MQPRVMQTEAEAILAILARLSTNRTMMGRVSLHIEGEMISFEVVYKNYYISTFYRIPTNYVKNIRFQLLTSSPIKLDRFCIQFQTILDQQMTDLHTE